MMNARFNAELPALQSLGASYFALSASTAAILAAEAAAGQILAGRSGGVPQDRAAAEFEAEGRKPYEVRAGAALLQVAGFLRKDHPFIGDPSATGYLQTAGLLAAALADSDVRGIVLLISSGGGLVDGLFDLTAAIRAARAVKPVVAIVDGCACSAAYAIAAAATSIAAGRFARVGSIGVVGVHWEISGLLKTLGVRPTIIFAGARKVDGNMFEPLPEAVRAEWEAEFEEMRREFAADVERGRGGRLTAAAALATEAREYATPSQIAAALEAGLVDAILSPGEAFRRFADHLSAPRG